MTADVFRRLALVAGCSAWATAVALVWVHVGWAAGLAAAVLGPAGAFVLSLEPAPEPETDRGGLPRPTVRQRITTGRSRRAIERDARLHRDDED